MSTPRRRRLGRRCGFGEAARTGPRPEARREVLIAPAERVGPLAITRSVPRREGTQWGLSSLEAALGAPGEPQFLGEGSGCFLGLNCLGGEEKARPGSGAWLSDSVAAHKVGGVLSRSSACTQRRDGCSAQWWG